jgi:putative flippase GtrA
MMLMRVVRCLCVSVGTTVLSAVVLVVLALGLGVSAGIANIVAVCCGIVPSYVANRRWVWKRPGRGSLTREVLPFWVLSLTGLAVSTIAVARVAALTTTWTSSARAVALPVANLSVFAALWVVQFVLLDRVIFRQRGIETCPAP